LRSHRLSRGSDMKPHPRIRTTAKWGGAVLTVLLVVACVWSVWWTVRWGRADGRFCCLTSGQIMVGRWDCPPEEFPLKSWVGLHHHRQFAAFVFRFERPSSGSMTYLSVPLSLGPLIVAVPTFIAWRADRRAAMRVRTGACRQCGYNRHGLPAQAVCPECGAASTAGSDVQKPSLAEKDPT
jgi:hypothetical protein